MDDQTAHTVLGRLTFVDLSHMDAFFQTPTQDAWGTVRMPFSNQISRMSAELAANGYDLDVKPWLQSGWNDCTFIVEDKIVVLDHESDSRLAGIESEWKRRRAKSLIRGMNPISDLVRAFRQLLVTDLGKTIIMTHMAQDGHAIVSISFIGTTQKYYDWFTNFKMQQHIGMHYGFLSLAKQFESQATRILLPKLAEALGEASFSLADAVLEAKKPDSRILFWFTGHSQGGAIVQTYTHLLLSQGVLPHHIHAYTFGAPTVAGFDEPIQPGQYPIFNIINMDDVVTRVGAQTRLGMDLIYHPSDAFRIRHYGVDRLDKQAFERTLYASMQVQTTQDAMHWGIAFMHLLRDVEADNEAEALFSSLQPVLSMLRKVNVGTLEFSVFFEERLRGQLRSLTDSMPDEVLVAHYEASMRALLEGHGGKEISHALLRIIGGAHQIRPHKNDESYVPPYIAIVCKHLHQCRRGVWLPNAPAQCLDSDGNALFSTRRPLMLLMEPQPAPDAGENIE